MQFHLRLLLATVAAVLVVGQPHYPPGGFSPVSGPVEHVSRTGPLEEIKKAGTRALIGVLLFVFGFPVLWFNEQRAAKMWKLFGRAAKMARVNVPSDSVQPQNESTMVHVAGVSSTKDELRDGIFGISVTNCAKLRREVEMYQWVETSETTEVDTSDGGKERRTTYSYHMEWKEMAIDSSSFQERSYENPPMPVQSESWQASEVSLGAFRLPAKLVGRLCRYVDVESEAGPKLEAVGRTFLQVEPGTYTTMGDQAPGLGDLKVTIEKVPCGETTVFALQDGDSFAPLTYTTEVGPDGKAVRAEGKSEPFLKQGDEEDLLGLDDDVGCCAVCEAVGKLVESNEEVFAIAEQTMTAKQILQMCQKEENLIHLLLQLVGFFMLTFGLDLMFQLVPALFRIIPFIGTWIQFFGNFFVHITALLLGLFFWCITVAFAWLWARPVKAVLILGVAALCVTVPTMMSH